MSENQTLVMPKLGLTMTEGALAEWRVAPGDSFAEGDILFVVETDKIANEVEAESAGRLIDIAVPEGETAEVGTVLAYVDFGGGQQLATHSEAKKPEKAEAKATPQPATSRPAPTPPARRERLVATPLARRLARDAGIDLASVSGSGPRGRIKADDVRAASANPKPAASQESAVPATGSGLTQRPVEMSRNQSVAARRTTQSKSTIPHFYLDAAVRIDALLDLRARVNASQDWLKTTLTHWMIAAIGRVMDDMPQARRVWGAEGPVEYEATTVGVVADVDGELFIPVIAGAGSRSIGSIANALGAMVDRARSAQLRAEDMQGAAVSISNLGMFGIDSVTPVIDVEQGMIIGVGRSNRVFRPDETGAPVACQEVTLTLACDHRIHNGVFAARFLGAVADYLEEPMRLLLSPPDK